MFHVKPFQSIFFFTFAFVNPIVFISAKLDYIKWGSSLSVERSNDVLISPDGTFSAGFHSVGDNAYCFAVWFTKSAYFIPVWMAKRDQPVNGRRSSLSLPLDGNLVLTDAGGSTVWETGTVSTSSVQLCLLDEGNLILLIPSTNVILWKSFDFPTDTLLPQQPLTKGLKLIASRSRSNYSSGFYSFFFDHYNVLRLLYDGPDASSIYWPHPSLVDWEAGRSSYSSSRIAVFNFSGYFQSTDSLNFFASDFGLGPKRRLTLDFDGNLRLYSLDENKGAWLISWQAISQSCRIHGLCGPNNICVYNYEQSQRRCLCPPGFKLKDPTDLSLGCQPIFDLSCDPLGSKFITVPNTDFYGYDLNYTEGLSLQGCMNICLELCSCEGFLYSFDGTGGCYSKTVLLNGYQSPRIPGKMYIKVPRNETMSDQGRVWLETPALNCTLGTANEHKPNEHKQETNSILYLWFVIALGMLELIILVTGWWFMYKKKGPSRNEQVNMIAVTGFKRFSYQELKEATKNFSEEIGRGGSGEVFKGKLSNGRVIAVKRIAGVNQGFLAEVSIIGRINHMNLIRMWGFCVKKKYNLLVYEYMEHRSLAENLFSNAIDFGKRFKIAIGTAKGLAYLHEECLEWVLHCDVKPQNILLDADYHPKVADFGLSKLRDRSGLHDSSFSRIRGTRGYMAPEWITNQPITSKVDVYGYGIVVLEMVTGKSSTGFYAISERGERDCKSLVTWVREMMFVAASNLRKIKEIMDSRIDATDDDAVKMEVLVRVALQCVEEDKDARPTMSQVVEMLQGHENNL
ncbi:putative receptor protein kinase ZmPK1 [Cinnamomum micranthum f. kanehirae]|uniref:Receptor-like serine/threonine-protein kinase n=1 Tax=Cinnamomum micranthum f. kanehirae TaxID=337451 RepID=A0A443PLJ7_9MAGN|nr:putative receptor protein kinase ZmPK1 [Cinnamomum micranthum f. kanehirae]